MSKEHEHRFERLSDDAIFCACGEIRTAADATCSREHYPPVTGRGADRVAADVERPRAHAG